MLFQKSSTYLIPLTRKSNLLSKSPKDIFLNFLDLSISIKNNKINYKWFSKPCHSGITLKKDSWLPNHIKDNFVKNSVRYVQSRCSDNNNTSESLAVMKNRLENNGFHCSNDSKNNKAKNKNQDSITLALNFVSDSYDRKLNKLKRKYNLPIRITSKPGNKLISSVSNKLDNKNDCACYVCKDIGPKYRCTDKHLVYKFTCLLCHEFYIGQTCRPFRYRVQEHERSLRNRDRKSALSEHNLTVHSDEVMTINNFNCTIMDKQRTAITTKMAEARCIALNMPKINRRHELI